MRPGTDCISTDKTLTSVVFHGRRHHLGLSVMENSCFVHKLALVLQEREGLLLTALQNHTQMTSVDPFDNGQYPATSHLELYSQSIFRAKLSIQPVVMSLRVNHGDLFNCCYYSLWPIDSLHCDCKLKYLPIWWAGCSVYFGWKQCWHADSSKYVISYLPTACLHYAIREIDAFYINGSLYWHSPIPHTPVLPPVWAVLLSVSIAIKVPTNPLYSVLISLQNYPVVWLISLGSYTFIGVILASLNQISWISTIIIWT